jgi:hypothetical protein
LSFESDIVDIRRAAQGNPYGFLFRRVADHMEAAMQEMRQITQQRDTARRERDEAQQELTKLKAVQQNPSQESPQRERMALEID